MSGEPNWSGVTVVPGAPLVFGDGTSQPVTGKRRPVLPPQATMAGFIRARFWAATPSMAASDHARELLATVSLKGPWLVGPRRLARPGTAGDPAQTIWVPAPADARVFVHQGETTLNSPARPVRLVQGEGAWSGQFAEEEALLAVDTSDGAGGRKSSSLPFPLWRLDHVVAWGLGRVPPAADLPELGPGSPHPVLFEDRVHVGIDDQRGTATAEALFTTHGVRVGEGYAIAADVLHPGNRPAGGVAVLGGRSRPARVQYHAPSWPSFDLFAEQYRAAAGALSNPILRLQLVTPGCFGGWRPDVSSLPGGLRLVAALVPDFETESGWNMVLRQPRSVRRLVPPGAVYWFGVEEEHLMDLCKHFWENPLPGAPPTEDLLALPESDGFGQVVPGLTSLEQP